MTITRYLCLRIMRYKGVYALASRTDELLDHNATYDHPHQTCPGSSQRQPTKSSNASEVDAAYTLRKRTTFLILMYLS